VSAFPLVNTAPLEARKKGMPSSRAAIKSIWRMTADELRMPAIGKQTEMLSKDPDATNRSPTNHL
jgi:hypothetical protein